MANKIYKNVTVQLAPDVESPISDDVVRKSAFLRMAISLNLGRIVGPAADDLDTQKLGTLWSDVLPKHGKFTIEIATVLPFYLPTFEGVPDYSAMVNNNDLVISSRMLRCFFSEKGQQADPLQYYLVHARGLSHLLQLKPLEHIHPIPLRTFVAKKLVVAGTCAERLVQSNYYKWVHDFVTDLSRFLDSIRAASPVEAKQLLPQSAATFLSIFWIHVEGECDKSGTAQFAGDIPSAAFRPLSNLDRVAVQLAKAFLANGAIIPVHESALALANTYLHYGYLGLALVQVCIACESALGQSYQRFLVSRGVSKTKYAEAERDITFSQLLNLHLAAAKDLNQLKDHDEVIGQINWARKCRNDMVHKGKLENHVRSKEVQKAIDAAQKMVAFLA